MSVDKVKIDLSMYNREILFNLHDIYSTKNMTKNFIASKNVIPLCSCEIRLIHRFLEYDHYKNSHFFMNCAEINHI